MVSGTNGLRSDIFVRWSVKKKFNGFSNSSLLSGVRLFTAESSTKKKPERPVQKQ